MESTQIAPTVTLSNGVKMPVIGVGTFFLTDEKIMVDLLRASLDIGYRYIDTAVGYNNHAQLGRALQVIFSEGKYKREDVFIVTKLFPSKDVNAISTLKKALVDLEVTYVDQYLVHWPLAGLVDGKLFHKPHHVIWPQLEDCYELGLTKSIGVSNYNVQSLLNILSFCQIRPHVNQIEFSIYVQTWPLHEFGQKFDIVTVGYSNLSRGGADVKTVLGNKVDLFNEPVLVKIAESQKKSVAQVVLRFLQSNGIIVIPKSEKVERLKENFNIFDFDLTNEETEQIKKLHTGLRSIDTTQFKMFGNFPVFD